MRQPVEDGYIKINRNSSEVVFPSKVMLVAAANPCKCGNLWDESKECTCTPRQIASHMRKLSGPFSDRIDIHLKMLPVSKSELEGYAAAGETVSSEEMRKSVERAIWAQRARYGDTGYDNNGSLDDRGIERFCITDREGTKMLSMAYEKMGLTMRAYKKVLKVARTIADIEGEERINESHIAEALMYRVSGGAGQSG